jgi:tetratricopeptide (TPR) repeat protein
MANTGVGVELRDAQAETINIQGVTVGATEEELVAAPEHRGLLAGAELAGLQRRTIITLAQRLKPAERRDFEQAVTELERAVEVALDVIARGERGTNDDAFVNTVLARVAERVRRDDLDGGAQAIDAGLVEIESGYRRSQKALLEEGIKVDILRRDAAAVARRIEMLVAVDYPTDRPAWQPEFRERLDSFQSDGETRGTNFSLSIAIELARRMVATARDRKERWATSVLLGNALRSFGNHESGTASLEGAVTAYRAALQECARQRVPLDWAMTQNNLGTALGSLGERESGTARLEEAVAAFRVALEERTRERAPIQWATTQINLGTALGSLGERESGTAKQTVWERAMNEVAARG